MRATNPRGTRIEKPVSAFGNNFAGAITQSEHTEQLERIGYGVARIADASAQAAFRSGSEDRCTARGGCLRLSLPF
jgi:hypothetical protein